MKKINLIMPILSIAGLAGMVAPLVSCSCGDTPSTPVVGGRKILLDDSIKSQCTVSGKLDANENMEITPVAKDANKEVYNLINVKIGEEILPFPSEWYEFTVNSTIKIYKSALSRYEGDITINVSIENKVGKEFQASECCDFTVISEEDKTCSVGAKADFQFLPNCSIVIPEKTTISETEYTVIKVNANGFNATSPAGNIKKVQLPNSITEIGNYAFYKCCKLTDINMPSNLNSLGQYALFYTKINEITFSKVTTIGSSCFASCEKLEKVEFATDCNITQLPSSCFSSCTALTTIILPKNLTYIGGSCFYNTVSLTNIYLHSTLANNQTFYLLNSCRIFWNDQINLYVDNTLTITDTFIDRAFTKQSTSNEEGYDYYLPNEFWYDLNTDGTYSINGFKLKDENIVIPSTFKSQNVTKIGAGFSGNKTIKNLTIPNSITEIQADNAYGFNACSNLESITFEDGSQLKTIPDSCFYETSINSITLPESIETISNAAFYNCTKLSTIIISSSIKNIYASAFHKCPLTSITFGSNNKFNIYKTTSWKSKSSEDLEKENFVPAGASQEDLKKYLATTDAVAPETTTIYYIWNIVTQ